MKQARGTFEVKLAPTNHSPDASILSMTIEKQIHGGLEGVTKGEMLSAGNPKQGAAGYVAVEQVTGTIDGRSGSFALMHFATMHPGAPPEIKIIVVPGSATGELKGLRGDFYITLETGEHSYTFEYDLPETESQ